MDNIQRLESGCLSDIFDVGRAGKLSISSHADFLQQGENPAVQLLAGRLLVAGLAASVDKIASVEVDDELAVVQHRVGNRAFGSRLSVRDRFN